jgi:hypothetical protein
MEWEAVSNSPGGAARAEAGVLQRPCAREGSEALGAASGESGIQAYAAGGVMVADPAQENDPVGPAAADADADAASAAASGPERAGGAGATSSSGGSSSGGDPRGHRGRGRRAAGRVACPQAEAAAAALLKSPLYSSDL